MNRAWCLALLPLCACLAHVPPPAPPRDCPQGGEPYDRSELYFGLKREGGRAIPETSFETFVDSYVVPELASGFTLLRAEGRYLAGDQDIREPSRVLVVFHHADQGSSAALERIRARYKELFNQQSVLRVDSRSCVRF